MLQPAVYGAACCYLLAPMRLELNLTPETRSDVDGLKSYLNLLESILMSSLWFKILTVISTLSWIVSSGI